MPAASFARGRLATRTTTTERPTREPDSAAGSRLLLTARGCPYPKVHLWSCDHGKCLRLAHRLVSPRVRRATRGLSLAKTRSRQLNPRESRSRGERGGAPRPPAHWWESHIQNARSRRPNCGRFDLRRSRASCCRSAKFSRVRSVRVLIAARRRAPNRSSTRDIALHGSHAARQSSSRGIEFGKRQAPRPPPI